MGSVRQIGLSASMLETDSVMDDVDAQVYLDSLPRQRVRSECLRYLLSPVAMSNDKVRRVIQQTLLNETKREAAQQAQQRAVLQGQDWVYPLGSLGRHYVAEPAWRGNLAMMWGVPPAPKPRNWAPWIVALKILGCVLWPLFWWIFSVSV